MVTLNSAITWSTRPHLYTAMHGEDLGTSMDGWVLHWPGTRGFRKADPDRTVAYLRSYEDYHVETKGWRGIAYDYAIDLKGRAYILRGTGRSAATSGDYDEDGIPNNRETDAILLVLGYEDVPSAAMTDTLIDVIAQLGGPRDYIIGHRQAKGTTTTCPGGYVMDDIVRPIQRDGWPSFVRAHTPVRWSARYNVSIVASTEPDYLIATALGAALNLKVIRRAPAEGVYVRADWHLPSVILLGASASDEGLKVALREQNATTLISELAGSDRYATARLAGKAARVGRDYFTLSY